MQRHFRGRAALVVGGSRRAGTGAAIARGGHRMTTLQQARRFALSLPDVHEEPHFEKASFRVGGKIFATVPEGGRHLHVFVDDVVREAAVAQRGVEELWWGKQITGVRIDLTTADAVVVRSLLEAAWRRRAPKRLTAAVDAAATRPAKPRKRS